MSSQCLKQWTEERLEFLKENYPLKGKLWCMQELGMTESQIRNKASALQLKAMGKSEAWADGVRRRALTVTGRKRPAQAEVMRAVNARKKPLSEEKKRLIGDKARKRIAENGHPRGALGMVHSEEARRKMSESGIRRAMRETEDVVYERTIKGMRTKAVNGALGHYKDTKTSWKAGWRDIGGKRKYFRSRWEANYARYLEFLKAAGEIAEWEHEPETFWFDGIKRGCMSYLPDFRVTNLSGKVEYHEVKGWMDDRSKTKIKRMAKYHPAVTLLVIEKKQYTEIQNKISRLIPDWE